VNTLLGDLAITRRAFGRLADRARRWPQPPQR
jgi:hypothetical protein